jgi:8-oxo-dGTP pyrophosphatase MutT (NUDIX family)
MIETRPRGNEIVEFNSGLQNTVNAYLQTFPTEGARLAQLADNLQNPKLDLRQRSTIPQGHIAASGIILSPDNKNVLMLLHKSLGLWVVPGGHYDLTDNIPENAALRESHEETGYNALSVHPWHREHGIPLDIDTHFIPENPKRGEGAHVHYDFRYVLQLASTDNVAIDPAESLGYKWIPIEDIDPKASIAPAIAKLPLVTHR